LRTLQWIVISGVILAGTLLVSRESRADAKCPWLNAATAAGVLGGEVQMTVTAPMEHTPGQGTYQNQDQIRMDRFDVNCEFNRKADSGIFTLKIIVETMKDPAKEFAGYLARCTGTPVPLRAIGNEAVFCAVKTGAVTGEEKIVARVRDRAFVLTVIRPPVPSAPATVDGVRDDTRNIAEQIAGSLF
jgi:hypothetical protein